MLVKASARSAARRAARGAAQGRHQVPQSKPKPAAARASTSTAGSSSIGSSGGSSVGGGSWAAVETYYLRLMNCTRTGGSVTSSGSCSSPGGRSVARSGSTPGSARRSPGRTPSASRPRATVQPLHRRQPGRPPPARPATRATSGPRTWAAAPATRTAAVLGSHLYFQSERSWSRRRPLREPDEHEVRPGRDRRLGLGRTGPPRHRLLPPALIGLAADDQERRHPPPQRAAAARRPVRACPRRSTRGCSARTCGRWTASGRSSSTGSTRRLLLPVPPHPVPRDPAALRPASPRSQAPAEERPRSPPPREPEADLELDEDFLRRIREV